MARSALMPGVLVVLAASLAVHGADPPTSNSEMITFRAVDTDDGPRVQIEVGGLIIQTEQFTFLHEGHPSTTVTAVGGRVEMRGPDGNRVRAETISMVLRGGVFDHCR